MVRTSSIITPSLVELVLHTLPGDESYVFFLFTGSLREAHMPVFQLLWRFWVFQAISLRQISPPSVNGWGVGLPKLKLYAISEYKGSKPVTTFSAFSVLR